MLRKYGFALLVAAALAIVGWPVMQGAQAVLSGTDSRQQAQQVALGQLQVGSSTGTASSNAVTINAGSGVITTEALSTAAGATQNITLTNDRIAAGDMVFAVVDPASSAGTPIIANVAVSASTAVFKIQNIHASTALNAAVKIYFVINKAGNSN